MKCSSPYSSLFLSPLARTTPSSRGAVSYWKNLSGYCKARGCGKLVSPGFVVVCANYLSRRGAFGLCRGAWCAGCYRLEQEAFRYREYVDDDSLTLARKEEELYLKARDGDHLMCPFQCELCHFRNITSRDPVALREQDCELLKFMRRVNLDACLSNIGNGSEHSAMESKLVSTDLS